MSEKMCNLLKDKVLTAISCSTLSVEVATFRGITAWCIIRLPTTLKRAMRWRDDKASQEMAKQGRQFHIVF